MKLFICIISCQKNLSKLNFLRQTWLKEAKKNNIEYRIFVGGASNTDKNNDVVFLNVDDSYESLRKKSIEAFNFSVKNFNFDYLLKIDDDTFVDIEELQKINLTTNYIGWKSSLNKHKKHLEKYKNYMIQRALRKNLNHYYFEKIDKNFNYAVGAFYFLKRELLKEILILSEKDDIFNSILQEDIAIGYLCDKLSATLTDIKSKFDWYQVSKNTFFHPVNSILFKLLYKNKYLNKREEILKDKIMLNNFYRFNLNE
jgi:hypothetical protein